MAMFKNLSADIKRYTTMGGCKISPTIIFSLIFTQGIWALVIFRFGAWCDRVRMPIISIFLNLIYFFLNKFIEIITGISISYKAEIGPGLYIGHFGGIFIHSDVKMGENCNIGQQVTLGTLGVGKKGAPIIGNNVFIGAGAKVLGHIIIGNNVRIGANAVVLKDIPDNATAVGIPAQVVKIKK